MRKIVPITKEHITKIAFFGINASFGIAKYAFKEVTSVANYTVGIGKHGQRIHYLKDNYEEHGIITHRLILKRLKIEVKTVVQYDYSFA